MFQKIQETITQITNDFGSIPAERKALLDNLINFIKTQKEQHQPINLIFICTHNSRRSHLSQVWAQVAAHHYGIGRVNCYSGGTEATALFPSSAAALVAGGLQIQKLSRAENPVYSIKYDENRPAVIGFSKKYDSEFNPQSGFGAVMTCTHADANCPFIPTAAKRISLPFEDPKAFDGTDQQAAKYEERSLQIATELFYAFSQCL